MQKCSVCDTESAPYKCPKCRLKYCSVNCCTEHKKLCSAITPSPAIDHNAVDNSATKKSSAYQSEDFILLSEEQKEKLKSCSLLRNKLKSKRLWQDIRNVDISDDRQHALKKLRAKNAEFEDFVGLLLSTVSGESK